MNVTKQHDNSSSLSDVNTNNNNDDNVDIISTQRGINAFWIDIETGAKRNNASGDALILRFIIRHVIIIGSPRSREFVRQIAAGRNLTF